MYVVDDTYARGGVVVCTIGRCSMVVVDEEGSR